MSNCENCGAFVTSAFIRVFAPAGEKTVEKCPECTPTGHIDGGDLL